MATAQGAKVSTGVGSLMSKRGEPKSCLGQVFNYKLGFFAA